MENSSKNRGLVRKTVLFFILIILPFSVSKLTIVWGADHIDLIDLIKGQKHTISLSPGEVLEENCKGVVRFAQKKGRRIVASAQKPGLCYFRVKGRGDATIRKITVYAGHGRQAYEALRFVLEQYPGHGLEIRNGNRNGELELNGAIRNLDFYIALQKELAPFGNLSDDTKVSSNIITELTKKINKELKQAGYENLSVSFDPRQRKKRWHLGGTTSVKDPPEDPIDWISRHYWPMRMNYTRVFTGKPQIELEMELHEIRRNFGRSLGTEWPSFLKVVLGQFSNPAEQVLKLTNTGVGGAVSWIAHANEWSNLSKLVAHPKLVCLSGEKVVFRSGGSFAIENKTRNYAFTEWKRHGLRVSIQPTWHDESRTIHADFKATYSDPQQKEAKEKVRTIHTTELNTSFRSRENESVILTGFTQQEEKKKQKNLPFSRHIPWVRWMTGYKEKEKDDKEIVIRVTMRIKRHENTL